MLAFLLLLSLVPGSQEPSMSAPLGQLVEKVTCAREPNQSYALYLPRNYDKSRKWPVLYAFDHLLMFQTGPSFVGFSRSPLRDVR